MQSAPSRPTYLDSMTDAYASNGLGMGSSFYPQQQQQQQQHQRVSPLTFAAGLPGSIGSARARAPYASAGLFGAATVAAVSPAALYLFNAQIEVAIFMRSLLVWQISAVLKGSCAHLCSWMPNAIMSVLRSDRMHPVCRHLSSSGQTQEQLS